MSRHDLTVKPKTTVNTKVYLIGSLRNEMVPRVAQKLREQAGVTVFDDWYAAGPEADDYWQKYETARGHSYSEALKGNAANHVYSYDKSHLDSSDMAVLMLPAGKSGHLEFGYMIGKGKPGIIFMPDKDPERWDVMYLFANNVVHTIEELVEKINENITAKDRLVIERLADAYKRPVWSSPYATGNS